MFEKPPTNETEYHANRVLRTLDLEWNDLQNKTILDIGAGGGSFAKAAKQHAIDVVTLDRDEDVLPSDAGISVVGIAENLPFVDEVFDLAISTSTIGGPVPFSWDEAGQHDNVGEALRVLKKDGELRFGPVQFINNGTDTEQANNFLQRLSNYDASIYICPLQPDDRVVAYYCVVKK